MENNYVLDTWDNELTQFALDFIDNHTFINIRSLRKDYCSIMGFDETQTMSITIKLGKIVKGLRELGFVTNWSNKTIKNRYRGRLKKNLEKKNDQF